MGLTCAPDAARAAPPTKTANPKPANSRPRANLAGLDGFRFPNFIQSQAKTGASAMMNNGCKDCIQLAGNENPKMLLSVLRSANRFSVEPACSKTDQNIADATKSTATTIRRLRS